MVSRFTYWSVTSPALRFSLLCVRTISFVSHPSCCSRRAKRMLICSSHCLQILWLGTFILHRLPEIIVVSDRIISTLKVSHQFLVIKKILLTYFGHKLSKQTRQIRDLLVKNNLNAEWNSRKCLLNLFNQLIIYINIRLNVDTPLARL